MDGTYYGAPDKEPLVAGDYGGYADNPAGGSPYAAYAQGYPPMSPADAAPLPTLPAADYSQYLPSGITMAASSSVAVQPPDTYATKVVGSSDRFYETLNARYRSKERSMLALMIVQGFLWFPLGFLYLLGRHPPRGRVHMGVGIFFFLVSLALFCFMLAVSFFVCTYDYYYGVPMTVCYYSTMYKWLALIMLPFIALAAASIGVGAAHRKYELALRVCDLNRFYAEYPERAGFGSDPLSH